MTMTTDTPAVIQLPVALVLLGLGGLAMGMALWTPPAEEEPESEADDSFTATVGTAFFAAAMWFDIIIFGSAFLLSLFLESIGLALIFGAITLAFVVGLSFNTQVTVSDEGVEVRNSWGRRFLKWSDVDKYQVDERESTYVLLADDGQMPLPSMGMWSGNDKHRARRLFRNCLASHDISRETTELVHFRFRVKGIP